MPMFDENGKLDILALINAILGLMQTLFNLQSK